MANRKLARSNRDPLWFENGSNLLLSPERLYAGRLMSITPYDADCNNAKRYTALLLKVGMPKEAEARDIHRGMS